MPYRENGQFNPEIHGYTSPDKKAWVRKSALENDELNTQEANQRNKEKAWYNKLFGKKLGGVDVTQEQALKMHLDGIIPKMEHSMVLGIKKFDGLKGEFNGVPLDIYKEGGEVDGEKIGAADAQFIMKKLWPLIEQMKKDEDEEEPRRYLRAKQRVTPEGRAAVERLLVKGRRGDPSLPEAADPKRLTDGKEKDK